MSCAARALTRPLLVMAVAMTVTLALLAAPSAPATTSHPAPVKQSVKIRVLPPIAQPGAGTARPAAARSVVTARIRPVMTGRRAVLELRRHGHWKRVDSTRIKGERVAFTPRTRVGGRAATYRVRALAYGGFRGVKSDPVRTNAWGHPGFVEEFDGDALGPAWEHRIQFYNPWGGRSCSKGDPSAVAVGGGALRLSVLADPARAGETCPTQDRAGNPAGSYAYRLNGHVSTQSSFDFRYGVAAARMRFQHPRGQHASFWMQPRGLLEEGTTPWGAEIDVIEFYGSDGSRERMSTTVHRRAEGGEELTTYGGPIPDPDRFLASRSDRWWSAYHVFSVEWTPREYVFRIDGQETLRTRHGVSHHPEFLILSILSSDYELGWIDGDGAALPQHAYVDWVQVWPQS